MMQKVWCYLTNATICSHTAYAAYDEKKKEKKKSEIWFSQTFNSINECNFKKSPFLRPFCSSYSRYNTVWESCVSVSWLKSVRLECCSLITGLRFHHDGRDDVICLLWSARPLRSSPLRLITISQDVLIISLSGLRFWPGFKQARSCNITPGLKEWHQLASWEARLGLKINKMKRLWAAQRERETTFSCGGHFIKGQKQ